MEEGSGAQKVHAPLWGEPAVPQKVFLNPVIWGQGWGLLTLKQGRALWMESGAPPGRSQPAGPVLTAPRPQTRQDLPARTVGLPSPFSVLRLPRHLENTWLTFPTAAAVLIPISKRSPRNLAASDSRRETPEGTPGPTCQQLAWGRWPGHGRVRRDLGPASQPRGCRAGFTGAALRRFRARHLLSGFPSFMNERWQQPVS